MNKKFPNEQYDSSCDDRAKNCDLPTMKSILAFLTNPAFVFGALSGALFAHFILGPLLFG